VSSVALLILLNRGAKAYELFVDRGIEVFGHLPPVAREVDEVIIGTLDQAKDYFLAHFGGELPARQQLFSEALPEAFVGYSMMHRTAINESSLPARYAEMVLCTAMSATYQFSLLPVHVSGARKHGASDAELAESVLCAVPASGVTAWVGGAGAIRSVS
jgi:alkylhydroperoxidase/carboxymuconolactone decarboxylase family protein YurZ